MSANSGEEQAVKKRLFVENAVKKIRRKTYKKSRVVIDTGVLISAFAFGLLIKHFN